MPVTPVAAAASAKPGSSDHCSTPMIRNRGSSVSLVDPDPLDRARRRALAAADLGALERGTRRRRRGEQEVAVAEDDLGVRADVDDELDDLALVGRLGQDHAGRVGADVAGDAGQDVDAGTGVDGEIQLGGPDLDGSVGRQRERRGAQRHGIDAQHEVMHDRVADDRDVEDLVAADAGVHRELGDQPVERLADGDRHLGRPLGMHHRVAHAAHQVLAEADLRVHHAVAGEDRAVGEVREVAGDRRRADVDRDAERPVVEAGPDRDDLGAVMDRHRHGVVALLERGLERADDAEVGPQVRQAPLALERLLEAGEVAGRRGELGLRHLDVVEADHRVDAQLAQLEALAHDLAVDLALRRNIDDDVAADVRRAAEATARVEALLAPVVRLDRAERAQVARPSTRSRASGSCRRSARPGSGRRSRARRRPSRCRRRAPGPRRAPSSRSRTGRAGPRA